jgi:hypothetical protein
MFNYKYTLNGDYMDMTIEQTGQLSAKTMVQALMKVPDFWPIHDRQPTSVSVRYAGKVETPQETPEISVFNGED